MSLHNAKAHFNVASNYAKTPFEREMVQAMVQLADGMRERYNRIDERMRAIEQAIQVLKNANR